MAVGDEARARREPLEQRAACLDEGGQPAGLDRDIVLEARALVALRFRNRLAQAPEGLALRSEAAVTASRTSPRSIAAASAASKRPPRFRIAGCQRGLDERRTRRAARRTGRARRARGGQTNSSAMRGRSSKVVTASPERLAQPAQQRERGRGRIERGEGGRDGGGARKQPERCRGHDAERAFGADEELLQVVAGVVLAQRRQLVEHAPVRQHDLEAEHERAHHAVAQHRRAAGVRRDDAAERALPSEPSDIGSRRFAAAAADCSSASTQPASAVIESSCAIDRADLAHAPQRQRGSRCRPARGVAPPQ